MELTLRLSLLVGIIFYVCVILLFLKKKTISLKYSLLWLLSALVLIIMDIFPHLMEFIVHLLAIESVVNGVFLLFVFFILIILISLTSIVTKQSRQIKSLVQHVGIIEEEIEKIKNKL